ncbi:MAG: aldo/keto reductase [Caldisericia bacterium]|nr:aldo/keto reductase [Caldisericia bacterium]
MKKVKFGNTGLEVSKLCYGTMTFGPLQGKLSIPDAVKIVEHAWERGINFYDSAELYDTQEYMGALPAHIRHSAVITTKSYSETADKMRKSVETSLREMKLDVIPIFLLHEQESALTLTGHREALDTLLEFKHKGLIKAVGVSTHTVEVTRVVRLFPELEVIFPMHNIEGYGIKDGTRKDMESELEENYRAGLGVYLMKSLGGGKLLHRAKEAIEYSRDFPFAHSVAIGMKDEREIDYNADLFEDRQPSEEIKAVNRKMFVSFWCEGCGKCIKACPQGAIKIVDEKAQIDSEKCVLCTYCVESCPVQSLRII